MGVTSLHRMDLKHGWHACMLWPACIPLTKHCACTFAQAREAFLCLMLQNKEPCKEVRHVKCVCIRGTGQDQTYHELELRCVDENTCTNSEYGSSSVQLSKQSRLYRGVVTTVGSHCGAATALKMTDICTFKAVKGVYELQPLRYYH